MTPESIQEEIAIIRSMVEKTRRETAESGHFFMAMGIFSMIAVIAIHRLETTGLSRWVLPAFVLLFIGSGIIGYLTVSRKLEKNGVKSYAKTLCYSTWFACSVPMVLAFFFPMIGAIPWQAVPILSCMIAGIAIFMTGIIFAAKAIALASLAWWGGAVAMGLIHGTGRMFIMLAVLFMGWVLPGWILNRRYRRQAEHHGS